MATKYTYSISDDFPNETVAPEVLTDEINTSESISETVDHIHIKNDDCDIWMSAALDGAEQTALNAIVAAHQGESYQQLFSGHAESEGESTTSSESYIEKINHNDTYEAGDYLINWFAEMQCSAGNTIAKLRLKFNDEIIAESHYDPNSSETGDNWKFTSFCGFKRKTITAGTHTIKMEFCGTNDNKSVTIRRARINISPTIQ